MQPMFAETMHSAPPACSASSLSSRRRCAISGCNSDDTNVNSPVSLKNIVYGGADNKAPAELNIKDTMMMQMRNLFDRIKNENDFTKLTMDLGDGSPVAVLSTTTGDKFLPGKLALGLSYVLIDMKKKGNANYKDYLAAYQRITKAMIVPMQPADPTKYLYFNTSFGEYYFLLALNKFKDAGMLDEVFNDTETIAALKARLNFCDMFGSDASGSTNTCPQSGTPINIDSLNTAKNYYGVAYGIAGLRQRLGWNNPSFSSATDSSIANMTARDALLRKLISFGRTRKTCGGDFKHTDFGKIILPFTLLRRLECALESTREASLDSQPATIEFLEAEFSVDFDALLS